MQALLSPSLTVYLFFLERHLTDPSAERGLVNALRLTLTKEFEEGRCYEGQMGEDLAARLQTRRAHDTLVIRLDLTLSGEHPVSDWARLSQVWEETFARQDGEASVPSPWGVTLLYHALLPRGVTPPTLPAPLELSSDWATRLEATPYGWLAVLGRDNQALPSGASRRVHRYLLLIPVERAEKVKQVFLEPSNQGIARIELYYQKAIYHALQQLLASQALGRASLSLRQSMTSAAGTLDFSDLYREFRELEEISKLLMTLLNQKAHAEMLLQSLRVNMRNFEEALEEMQFHPAIYDDERSRLRRHAEQLESDLHYTETMLQSAYAFQEMQRGIENNRLQRASVMLGTAAALPAGITIFNSFLDIWALILEGSGWSLPPIELRMGIGALVGVSWPLATYWAIERRREMVPVDLPGHAEFYSGSGQHVVGQRVKASSQEVERCVKSLTV
jgi:hypothetical protein